MLIFLIPEEGKYSHFLFTWKRLGCRAIKWLTSLTKLVPGSGEAAATVGCSLFESGGLACLQ